MNLSRPFIERPVGTLLLTIGLALAGIAAFFRLAVAPLPQVDYPTISVQASLSGASPEVMAQSVATPLERRLGIIAGVNELTSDSSLGATRVTLQFDLSKNIDTAAREVQAAINAARADLPATLRQNPTYQKVNPANQPVVTLALTSDTRSAGDIYDAVSNVIQQRISQVPGVGEVELGGGSLPAVRVSVDPYRLASYGISMEDVRASIEAANANRPKGAIQGADGRAWQVYTASAGRHADEYRPLVVAYRNDAPVRLGDVASVIDSVADTRTLGLYNGKRAIIVNITQQPNANLIKMVDAIRAALPGLRAQLPADIAIDIATDRTSSIRASIHEIEVTVWIALALVVVVVFAFLRDARSTFIPAAATLVSLLGTFGVMWLLGFSLNNLSLMAITVATGFVVDDAIVVLENTTRHLEEGMGRMEAALRGASEVGFTVLSISVSLVAVFIPLLFMGGIVGRLFREFAVTLSAAVMISLVLSLTTTPMLCAWLLRPGGHREEGRVGRVLERGYARVEAELRTLALDWALAMKPLVLLLLGLGHRAHRVPLRRGAQGLLPAAGFADADRRRARRRERVVPVDAGQAARGDRHHPQGSRRCSRWWVSPAAGARAARSCWCRSSPRVRSVARRGSAVIQRLQGKLARVSSGIRLFLMPMQDLRIGARQSNSTYQYTLVADDTPTLAALVEQARDGARQASRADRRRQRPQPERRRELRGDRPRRRRPAGDQPARRRQRAVRCVRAALGRQHLRGHQPVQRDPGMGPGRGNDRPALLPDVRVPANAAIRRRRSTELHHGHDQRRQPVVGRDDRRERSRQQRRRPDGAGPVEPGRDQPGAARSLHRLGAEHHRARDGAARMRSPASPTTRPRRASEYRRAGLDRRSRSALADGYDAVRRGKDRSMRRRPTSRCPTTVCGSFSGQAATFQAQQGSSRCLLILAALMSIYLVLGMLYESLIHPITVLSTLPAAGWARCWR